MLKLNGWVLPDVRVGLFFSFRSFVRSFFRTTPPPLDGWLACVFLYVRAYVVVVVVVSFFRLRLFVGRSFVRSPSAVRACVRMQRVERKGRRRRKKKGLEKTRARAGSDQKKKGLRAGLAGANDCWPPPPTKRHETKTHVTFFRSVGR